MRFNNRITFVHIAESKYDTETGNYKESEPVRTIMSCNLQQVGIQKRAEVFGDINKALTMAILRRPYNKPFTHVEYRGHKFQVIQSSTFRKTALYIEGDLIGAN